MQCGSVTTWQIGGSGGERVITPYVALLRAVNVGGTGKLPMSVLTEMCEAEGFKQARTYIASGNVIFHSHKMEDQVRSGLSKRLRVYAVSWCEPHLRLPT
jgi:hypothetical protein